MNRLRTGAQTKPAAHLNGAREGGRSRPGLNESAKFIVVAAGLLLALQVGGMIAETVRADAPWLTLACLVGPVGVVSAILWAAGRLL